MAELIRRAGISERTFYRWKNQYVGHGLRIKVYEQLLSHCGQIDPPDFSDKEDEVKSVQAQLDELQKKVARKEIPPIEFEYDKAVLKPESEAALQLVADLMLSHPDLKLMVFGHTCDLGSDKYNLWLSQKRAEAVKSHLIMLGVFGEFIRAKGYGESRPLVPNDGEENRAKNRRVEFFVTTRWWTSVY